MRAIRDDRSKTIHAEPFDRIVMNVDGGTLMVTLPNKKTLQFHVSDDSISIAAVNNVEVNIDSVSGYPGVTITHTKYDNFPK